jgi:hypothetical protein
MKSLSSSSVQCGLLVNFLFKMSQIFSAGLSSGQYGGKKTSLMSSGTRSAFALWNALLSNTIILNTSGLWREYSSRNARKFPLSQFGISSRILVAVYWENGAKQVDSLKYLVERANCLYPSCGKRLAVAGEKPEPTLILEMQVYGRILQV